ncbi:hypothetical protein AB0F73_30615, partial [Micromonospora purpureochromogenes]
AATGGAGREAGGRGAAPSRRPNRALGVLVAAGVALLLGLVGVLVLDDGPDGRTPAAPITAAPVDEEPTIEQTPSAEPPTAPPSRDERPAPRTAGQLVDEFAALLDRAEAAGDIDPRTADELRDKLTELEEGKPKDRLKRLRELAGRLAEAVEKDRIDDGTASELRDLLAGWPRSRGDD